MNLPAFEYFSLPGENDPTEALPPAAAAKYVHLRQLREDALALARAADQQQRDAVEKRNAERRKLSLIEDHWSRVSNAPRRLDIAGLTVVDMDNVPEWRTAKKALDQAQAEFDRLSLVTAERQARRDACGRLFEAVERYVRRAGGSFAPVETPAPRLRKGENLFDVVSRLRAAIAAKRAEITKIGDAPITLDMAKARARQQVEALAAGGAPDVIHTALNGGGIVWPKARAEVTAWTASATGATVRNPDVPTVTAGDGLALVAWLFKDELLARIEAEVEALASDDDGLDDVTRAARLRELKAELLDLERQEEAAIMASDTEILRREDASPEAVLMVATS